MNLLGVEFNGDCGVVFASSLCSKDFELDSFGVNSDGFLHVDSKNVNLSLNCNVNSCSLITDNKDEPVIEISASNFESEFDFKFVLVNSGIVVS